MLMPMLIPIQSYQITSYSFDAIVYNNFKDFQPLSIGEDEDFRSLMAEAEPRFCLLTRKYF